MPSVTTMTVAELARCWHYAIDARYNDAEILNLLHNGDNTYTILYQTGSHTTRQFGFIDTEIEYDVLTDVPASALVDAVLAI